MTHEIVGDATVRGGWHGEVITTTRLTPDPDVAPPPAELSRLVTEAQPVA